MDLSIVGYHYKKYELILYHNINFLK